MIHILHAGAQDTTALAQIHEQGFSHPWDESALRNLMDKPGCLVLAAYDPGAEIHGFIMIRQAADEAEILTIATGSAKRRKGVASKLLNHAIELSRLRGAKRMFLEVASGNKGALALYEKAGFAEVSRRPGYYRHAGSRAEDALVMSRPLSMT